MTTLYLIKFCVLLTAAIFINNVLATAEAKIAAALALQWAAIKVRK